jgi:hypothetical protein
MNGTARMRPVGLLATLVLGAFLQPVAGAETYVTRTNWVEKAITNVVEVRMPRNVFVNEFHTNWIEQIRTNVVVVYSTNNITKDVVRTSVVTHYTTNYINKSEPRTVPVDLVFTNFVDVFRTNVKILRLTNDIAVNLVQTNLVDRYRTNWQTLNFTNFETVLVMKTNWVTQPVTNVVRIDVPAQPAPAPSQFVAPKTQRAVVKSAAAAPVDGPVLEGAKTSSRSDNNLVEVLLRVRWPADTADAPAVQQWKIEREDGAFMTVGKEQTFKKELPIGNYKIEAKLQWDADAPVLILKGTLVVTANEVVVRQKPAGKRLAAVEN